MVKSCIFALVLVSVFQYPCRKSTQYSIDKASPRGTYRIKVELNPKKGTGIHENREHLKIQYFKGQQNIGTYETDSSDDYEVSLGEGLQVVEWVEDNVVRLGRDRSQQPFSDELWISNKTGEFINYLEIGYGRFESFRVFDLPPDATLRLSASPEFKPDGTSNYSVSYVGSTKSGISLEGAMKNKERSSSTEGPFRFQIDIDSNSFRTKVRN